MTRRSPYVIVLSATDRAVLAERARAYTASFAQVVRAKIVLMAADGEANTIIAQRLDVHIGVVSRWRKRFFEAGLAGLDDRPRTGRPRSFPPQVRAQVKAMACEPPAEREAPLSRWSSSELATQAVAEGLVGSISASTVRRWLSEDAIKPWQHRSWIFPRDPNFAVKAARVLDLYARIWQGVALGDDEYVISADEKSQLQALSRRHPDQPPGPGRTRRVEFEYRRHGTLAYLAGYDVHRAHLIGTIAPTTGIAPFGELVTKVMTTEPYASARRVFWIVDNGSSHAGRASIQRMRQAWPTAELVHLPIHASWLNQIEIVFSIIQRKVIKPADFADLDALAARLTTFEPRYNATATPFDWRFGRAELTDLLRRIDTHGADTHGGAHRTGAHQRVEPAATAA
jgi:transposase